MEMKGKRKKLRKNRQMKIKEKNEKITEKIKSRNAGKWK